MSVSLQSFNAELNKKARESQTPVTGLFELTGRCNLACLMCYVRRSPSDKAAIGSELSAKQWLEIGRQAAAAGLLTLVLTGGEPLLRPDFFEIYEGLIKLGLQISLNTNATLVTPEIARRLASYPPKRIAVTVYGASPETYDRVSGNAGAYDRTVRGIELLLDQGLKVNVRTTIIRQNRSDLDKIYDLSAKWGLKPRIVDYVFANREGVETDPYAVRLSPTDQHECTARMAELLSTHKRLRVSASDALEFYNRNKTAFSCSAGHCSFAVNYSGMLSACLLLDQPALPLTEGAGFMEQWKKIVGLCDDVAICEDCYRCEDREYCIVCPAILKCETGHFDQKVPYLCEIARLAAKSREV